MGVAWLSGPRLSVCVLGLPAVESLAREGDAVRRLGCSYARMRPFQHDLSSGKQDGKGGEGGTRQGRQCVASTSNALRSSCGRVLMRAQCCVVRRGA